MKVNVKVLSILVLLGALVLKLDCMPGYEDSGTTTGGTTTGDTSSAIDSTVRSSLANFGAYSGVLNKLNVLVSILNSVGDKTVSNAVILEYYDAVKRFDTIARAYSLSKQDISQIDKFFKQLLASALFYPSSEADINARISYWETRMKKVGLTPYQRALQRRNVSRGRSR